MTADDDALVEWRYAATAQQLAAWEEHPDAASITVEYRLPDAPSDEWWRVQVVTHAWLDGQLGAPYTALASPALLIVPDGSAAARRAAISRLLGRGPAMDLTRVAERVRPQPPVSHDLEGRA